MSRVTVSAKKGGRVYQRKFDHDEALARYQAGEKVNDLAREYGVSPTGVARVVVPGERERMAAVTLRNLMSGVCPDCGKEGISMNGPGPDARRCRDCWNKLRTTTATLTELQCVDCKRWLPDDQFPSNKRRVGRRGRHKSCRECGTQRRREYRALNSVLCEGGCGQMVEGKGRAYKHGKDRPHLCPQCWRALKRKDSSMSVGSGFTVLLETTDGVWEVQKHVSALNRRDALNEAFGGNGGPPEGRIVVVSDMAWKPGRAKTVQVLDIAFE